MERTAEKDAGWALPPCGHVECADHPETCPDPPEPTPADLYRAQIDIAARARVIPPGSAS